MAFNLCNISFNWGPDRSPSFVTKFTYLDVTDLNERGEDDALSESDRFDDDVGSSLWLTRTEEDEDNTHCIVQLSCPDPEFAQINGFSVLSESRTLEVSSEEKGYLKTVKGRKMTSNAEAKATAMYLCSFYFEENFPSLNLKFLSLGNRSTFCVQTVSINIVQHGIQSSPAKRSLDVGKLKQDIEDMGGTMSDRAKDFMATLEQYEKNKLSNTSSLLSQSSAVGASTNGLSNIMSSILGATTMKSLAGSGIGSNGDSSDIYSILSSVCGSISSRRVASAQQAQQCEPEKNHSSSTDTSQSSEVDSGLAASQDLSMVTSLVAEKLEQVKSDMRDELAEMKQEVLMKIDDAKSELHHKLDLILSLLGDLKTSKENT